MLPAAYLPWLSIFIFGTFNQLLLFSNSQSSDIAVRYGIITSGCVCFTPGEDFAVVQQEIIMMKDCKHSNIVAYFGSYLRWACDCCEVNDLLEHACVGQRESVYMKV